MKKLMLLAAILTIGTVATAAIDTGYSVLDSVKRNNRDAGGAGGIGNIKDITANDNQIHKSNGVNIFLDKGKGWRDQAQTKVVLKVIEPIKIEAESDKIYTEAVQGDELQIGDIGFKVSGGSEAQVTFKFKDELFELPGYATVKVLDRGLFKNNPTGFETVSKNLRLKSGQPKDIEVDLYFDLAEATPGIKRGTIVARAMYK